MSRIGKLAIPVPNGTTVSVDGQTIKAKGPKGEMTFTVAEVITPKFENGELSVMPRADLVKAAEDRIAQEKARGRRLPTFAEALELDRSYPVGHGSRSRRQHGARCVGRLHEVA